MFAFIAALPLFFANPSCLLSQEVAPQNNEIAPNADELGPAAGVIRMPLLPESEEWKLWKSKWKSKEDPHFWVRLLPKNLDHGESRIRPKSGICRKGSYRSIPTPRPVFWPGWYLMENDLVVELGPVEHGEWWVYLTDEELGTTKPQLVEVSPGKKFEIELDAGTFRRDEKWVMHFPKLPPGWLQAPSAFEQIAGAPFSQTDTGLDDVMDHSQFLFDPRSDQAVIFMNSYAVNPGQANGGFFWSVSLNELRAQAKKEGKPLVIDLRQKMPTISASIGHYGLGLSGSSVSVEPLPDDNGVYPVFPGDFHSAIVANSKCDLWGLPAGRYRISRYVEGKDEKVQSQVIDVTGPQFK